MEIYICLIFRASITIQWTLYLSTMDIRKIVLDRTQTIMAFINNAEPRYIAVSYRQHFDLSRDSAHTYYMLNRVKLSIYVHFFCTAFAPKYWGKVRNRTTIKTVPFSLILVYIFSIGVSPTIRMAVRCRVNDHFKQ